MVYKDLSQVKIIDFDFHIILILILVLFLVLLTSRVKEKNGQVKSFARIRNRQELVGRKELS